MATPVGPVPPDPNDPDLWSEWYDDEDGLDDATSRAYGPSRYGWPLRVLAALAVIVIIAVLVL